MFTKQHFEQIAEVLAEHNHVIGPNEDFDEGASYASQSIATELAKIFEKDNPRFNKEQFIDACRS